MTKDRKSGIIEIIALGVTVIILGSVVLSIVAKLFE